jgi:hypothetical protein
VRRPYRHRRQKRFHLYRYGFTHWKKHLTHEVHNHQVKRSPTSADSPRIAGERTTFERVQHPKRRLAFITAGIVIGTIVVIFAVATGLSYLTYRHVKAPLQGVQDSLTAIAHNTSELNTTSGRAETERQLAEADAKIAAAQAQIDGSIGLDVLGVFPGLHTEKVGLEQLVADLHATTLNALSLLRSVNTLAANSHGTNFSLPALGDLGTLLASTRAQLTSDDRPADALWGPLASDRKKFDREDARAAHLLEQGENATQFALEFLGASSPGTYLVVGENNAEMRDEGSTLSYSLLNTRNGAITETTGGTVNNIEPGTPVPGIKIPSGTQAAFGYLNPSGTWQSTNASPNFSFAGKDMQYMFADTAGEDVDGVVGIDVVALQALLRLTGPVTVPGIADPVTAKNAADVLLNQLYQGLLPGSSQGPRREALGEVASAAFHQLSVNKVDVVALARTLATEASERHLQVWDEVPQFESTIIALGASGNIDTDDPTRTFHVAVENATVKTAVTLTNHAPAGHAPSYQLGPDGVNSHFPGEYVGRVFLWAPRGSKEPGSVRESGLQLAPEVDLPVMPGQTATANFETTIPNAIQKDELRLVFEPQPRLTPETLKVHIVASDTQANKSVSLSKPTTLTWGFAR